MEMALVDKKNNKPIKVVVLGNSGVGKTSILLRHGGRGFVCELNQTVGASFVVSTIRIDDQSTIKLHIWDSAGQERFQSMVLMYIRNASAAFLVYDVTDRTSFSGLKYWIKALEQGRTRDEMFFIVLGNKTDLVKQRVVSTDEGKQFAIEHGAVEFFETSAQSGEGIEAAMFTIASRLSIVHGVEQSKVNDDSVRLEQGNNVEKRSWKRRTCCP